MDVFSRFFLSLLLLLSHPLQNLVLLLFASRGRPGVAYDIDNTLVSSSVYLLLAHLLTFLPTGFEATSIPWAILNIRKHPTRPKEYEPRSHKLTLYLGLPPRKLVDRE